MFKVKAQNSSYPPLCLGAVKFKYGSGSLSTTAFLFPPSLFFLSRKDGLTKLQPHRAIHENQQGVISSLCLGVLALSRALTHMPRQTAWSLPSHTQLSSHQLSPSAGFSFSLSSFYDSSSFLAFFVPYENSMQISSDLCPSSI